MDPDFGRLRPGRPEPVRASSSRNKARIRASNEVVRGVIRTVCLIGAVVLAAAVVHAQVAAPVDPLSMFDEQPAYVLVESGLGEFSAVVECDYATVPADSEAEAAITVRLADTEGAPAAGRRLALLLFEGDGSVMPDEPVTDAGGVAHFTYRAGRLAITNHFELLDLNSGERLEFTLPTSLTAEVTVELVDPATYASRVASAMTRPDMFDLALTAFPEALPADEVSSSRLTAYLTYKDGRPAAGFPVKFMIASGNGSVTQEQELTDRDGYITAFYRVSDRVGTVVIEAVELTTGERASMDITVVEAGPAKLKLWLEDDAGGFFEERAVLPADGISSFVVVAQVLSLVDTPIAGAKLQFKLVNQLGFLEVLEAETDGDGCIHAIYTAGTFAGTERIIAYLVSE